MEEIAKQITRNVSHAVEILAAVIIGIDIGKLTAIAVLRTALNYFLERELKHTHIMHSDKIKNELPVMSNSENGNEISIYQAKD